MSPYVIAFISTLCYAALGPIVKKVGYTIPPFTLMATSSLMIALVGGLIAFSLEREQVLSIKNDADWRWLIVFSMINLIGYVLYLVAIKAIAVAQYNMFNLLMPIIGGLFAVYLLKEPFHFRYVIAMIFMGIGLYIAVNPTLKQP